MEGRVMDYPVRIFNRRKFLIISDVIVSREEAKRMQDSELSNTNHNFFAYKSVRRLDGLFEISWYCNTDKNVDKAA